MTITINGTDGITTPEVTLDNTSADGGQVVLKSSGYSNWNLDNYSGRIRAYYGSTEYFTINSSGSVGIGVSPTTLTAAASSLQVYGGASQARIGLQNATTGSTATSGFHLCAIGDRAVIDQRSNSSLEFTTNATERARIDSSGNLLVGTTSNFSSKMALYYDATTLNGFTLRPSVNAATAINFQNASGTGVGRIDTSSTTTSYVTSSDYRLKENIAPMTGALSVVQALKPCTYTWKADGSDGQGFIAHELAEVVPQCVTGEKDAVDANGNPVYQGIDTSFLVATLTAAIQEQQVIIESLKTRIETLENK